MLRIKDIMKAKGFTQTDLANELGISQVALNKAINGNPTIETLTKIANVLDVDVRDLIEPTKNGTEKTLYEKNEDGTYTEFVTLHFSNLPNSNTEG